jgi:ribose transport system ATP-binding protein
MSTIKTDVRNAGSLLTLRELSKSFGGEQALDNAHLTVESGEVHGLLGENGSGKSTLIKILSGFHVPDNGELFLRGEPVPLPLRPGQFKTLGLSFVHQDLGLIESLTVAENFRLADAVSQERRWFVSWRAERRRVRTLLERYDVFLEPSRVVADLQPLDRALLAIVRAFVGAGDDRMPSVLVLDEPTVFLPRSDVDRLFSLIRRLVSEGACVLFVSHDLDEVLEITDRVTVLRDGRTIGTAVTADATRGKLIAMIVGRDVEMVGTSRQPQTTERSLVRVERLKGRVVKDASFAVDAGEIVGLTGLVGSGFEEIPYLLFGAHKALSGTLSINGETYPIHKLNPTSALGRRIALLPADRQHDGSIGSLPLRDNLSMLILREYFNGAWLRRGRLHRDMVLSCERFQIRPARPALPFAALSGGNQQKAMVAKWFGSQPALLLLHEPTQGVDIAARQHILSMIIGAAARGVAVLCVSSDHEQLAAICHRVLVFASGEVANVLTGDAISKERITELSYGTEARQ